MADDLAPEQPGETPSPQQPAPEPKRSGFLARFRRGRPTPASGTPTESSQEAAVTPGGYSYEVVPEDDRGAPVFAAPQAEHGPARTFNVPGLALVAGALAVVGIVGLGAWWLIGTTGGDGDERTRGDVSNIVGLFTQGNEGAQVARFEGELPDDYPGDIPTYPDAQLISSIRQINGEDVSYLAVYDTGDSQQEVADYFEDQLDDDPWQIEAGQNSHNTILHSFSKVDDANTTGVVFATDSPDNDVTTILVSVEVTSGADDVEAGAFEPGESRALPDNFPDAVPQYPDSTAIVSSYQKGSGGRQYVVSLVTMDEQSDVLAFYRDHLGDNGWTVEDLEAAESELEGAEAIGFSADESGVEGQIVVGELPQDDSYTRIDIQLTASSSGGG